MSIKQIVSIFLVVCIAILSCSCSNQNDNVTGKSTEAGNRSNELPKQTITIEYFEDYSIEQAISLFQYYNPDIIVKSEPVKFDSTKIDAFTNELLIKLNTGEGPDILLFEDLCFNSLSKAAGSGAFYDLNKFFENGKEISLSDFDKNIFDCGVINSERSFVPLRAECNFLLTTNNILKKNNINIDYKNWTWRDLLEIADKFQGSNNPSKYLLNFPISFIDIVYSFGKSFIDLKNKTSNFNNPELKEALKIYKKLYKCAPKYTKGSDMIADPTKGLKNNYFVMFENQTLSNSHGLLYMDSLYRTALGEEVLPISYPTWYGNGKTSSWPRYLFSVNSKCKNMEYAYKFLKLLLSEDSQSLKNHKSDSVFYMQGYPVNKKALSNDLMTIKSEDILYNINPEFKPASDELISRYKFITENGGVYINYDMQVQNIISTAAKQYLNGKISEGEALKRMDNEIELFLNE